MGAGQAAPEAVCLGIIVADVVCTPLPHVPMAGELLLVDEINVTLGGCASNTAIGLARLEVRTSAAGRIGQDVFGDYLLEVLEREGVDTGGVKISDGVGTSKTMIIPTQTEDRRFIHTIGASAMFSARDVDSSLLAGTKVVYVGGYLVMPRFDQDGLIDVFKRARDSGARTVLDVVLPRNPELMRQCERALEFTDVFAPNDDEARVLTGEKDPDRQAERLLKYGARTVIIKMGSRGSLTRTGNRRLRAGAYKVPFVDASGGGDAFDAGFIYGMVRGLGLEDSIRFASAMGASCVQALGTTTGLFTLEKAREFIRTRDLDMEAD